MWVTIVILIVINGETMLEEAKETKSAGRIVQQMEVGDPILKMKHDRFRDCTDSCHEKHDLSLNPATWNPFSRQLESTWLGPLFSH